MRSNLRLSAKAIEIHHIQASLIFDLGADNWKTILNTALESYLLSEEFKTLKNLTFVVLVMKLKNRDL